MLYTREKLLELLDRYLWLSTQGNETLRHVTEGQETQITALRNYLSNHPEGGLTQLEEVVEGLVVLQNRLLDELEKSSRKNRELQNTLDEANKEVRLDPLTHIFNRKKLEEDVNLLLSEGWQGRLNLYMIIIDADDFKQVNDKHGHQAGDKVLLYLVRTIRSILGQNNHLYRYGGEEFVALTLHAQMSDALKLAESIRSKIASAQMSHQGQTIQLTVSVGLAESRADDEYETFFARADQALFKAKADGKNRVAVAED